MYSEPVEVPKEEPVEAQQGEVKNEADDGVAASEGGGVTLDPLDCTLNFVLSEDRRGGRSMSEKGMVYMWSGARATLGIVGGRYYFKCKFVKKLPADVVSSADLDASHSCRIGVSWRSSEVFYLGETATSWGYDGAGEVVHAGKTRPYGQPFGLDDEILCTVDLESGTPAVSFAKNGEALGVAFSLDSVQGDAGALFPHVLVKNMEIALDFGAYVENEGAVQGYKPWEYASIDPTRVNMAPRQTVPFSDCEVLMLVGLPGSGKTSWALDHVRKHPEKRYIILGNSLVEQHMRIPAKKKQNMLVRFGHLETLVTEVFNQLLDKAVEFPRNYILDQTNVYANARVRKLKPFMHAGFRRTAVVFVIPDEVLFRRQKKQHSEEGKFVPDREIAEMKANFNPPITGKFPNFDEVTYVARKPPESHMIIEEQRKSSKAWLLQNQKRVPGQDVGDLPKRLLNEAPIHEIARFKSGGMPRIKGVDLGSGAAANAPGGMGPFRLQVVQGGLLPGMGGVQSATANNGMVALPTGPRPRPIQNLPVNGIQGPINVLIPNAPSVGVRVAPCAQPPMVRANVSSQRVAGPIPMEKPHPGGVRSFVGKATGSNAIPVGHRKPSMGAVPKHPMAAGMVHELHGINDVKIVGGQKGGVTIDGRFGMDSMHGEALEGGRARPMTMGVNGVHIIPVAGRSSDGRQSSDGPYSLDEGHVAAPLPMNFQKKQRTIGMYGGQATPGDVTLKKRPDTQGGGNKMIGTVHPMVRANPGGLPTRPAPQMQQVPLHQPPPPPRVGHGAGNGNQIRTPFTVNGLTVIPPAHVSQRHQGGMGLGENLRQQRMGIPDQNGGSMSQVSSSVVVPPPITAFQAHHQDTLKQQQQPQTSTHKPPPPINSTQNRQQPLGGQYANFVGEAVASSEHLTFPQASGTPTQGIRGASIHEQHNSGYPTSSSQPMAIQHPYHQGYHNVGARQEMDHHTAVSGQKDMPATAQSNPHAGAPLGHPSMSSMEHHLTLVQLKSVHRAAYEHPSNHGNGYLRATQTSQPQLNTGEDVCGAHYPPANQYSPGNQFNGQGTTGNNGQAAVNSQTYPVPGHRGLGGGEHPYPQHNQPQQFGQAGPNQGYPKTQTYGQQNGVAIGNYPQPAQSYVQPSGVQQYGNAGYQHSNPGVDQNGYGVGMAPGTGVPQADPYPQQQSYDSAAGQQYAQTQGGQAYGAGAEGYNYQYGTYDHSWNGYGYDVNAYASANQGSYSYNQDCRQ